MSCTRTTPWNSSPVGWPSTTVMLTVACCGVRRVMVPMTLRRSGVQRSASGTVGARAGAGRTNYRGRLRDVRRRVVRLDRDNLRKATSMVRLKLLEALSASRPSFGSLVWTHRAVPLDPADEA